MSSVHAVSFNRQYGSFRTTNAGIPKSPVIGGLNRGLIATISTTAQPSRVGTRSAAVGQTAASVKNQENQPAGSRVLAVTPRSCRKALTSNAGSVSGGGTTTKKIGLNSPLQSPQIIRSTRIEQNNWNKKLTTSNFCSLHSKSPGSSGTSVESIVPKYANASASVSSSNGGALKASFSTFNPRAGQSGESGLTSNGSQKRAYNVNKPIAKGTAAKCVNVSVSNSGSSSGSNRVTNGCVTHKIVSKKLYKESNAPAGYVAQMASALSNGLTSTKTTSSTSSSSSSSYSSKFPNGLPFENEFYRRPRRSLSEGRRPSEHPDAAARLSQSQRRSNSSDTVSLSAYGDEFSRKPSNEDLFVDFTKSLPATPKSAQSNSVNGTSTTTTTSSIVEYRNINHSNYFYKFESISCAADPGGRHLRRQRRPSPRDDSRNNNGGGAPDYDNANEDAGEECEGEKSTVYVAVATWVPKCNRLPYQQQDEAIGVLGPTSDQTE